MNPINPVRTDNTITTKTTHEKVLRIMMTSPKGSIFRVICLFQGSYWSLMDSPHKGQWRGALMFSLICAWTNGWTNNQDADDVSPLWRHCNDILEKPTVCHLARQLSVWRLVRVYIVLSFFVCQIYFSSFCLWIRKMIVIIRISRDYAYGNVSTKYLV